MSLKLEIATLINENENVQETSLINICHLKLSK